MTNRIQRNLANEVVESLCKRIFMPPSSPLFQADTKEEQTNILLNVLKEFRGNQHIEFDRMKINYDYYKKASLSLPMVVYSLCTHIRPMNCLLQFSDRDQLLIVIYKRKWRINALHQITDFCEAFQKAAMNVDRQYQIDEFAKLKKGKMKDLKKNAIIGKALDIVQMEKVPYIIDDNFVTKIIIYIRLSDMVRLEVNVPYDNYQAVLENMRTTIQHFRELTEKGIVINVKTVSNTASMNWINP